MVVLHCKNWIENKLFSLSGYVIVSIVLIHILLIPLLYYTLLTSYHENSYDQFVSNNTEIAGLLSDVISTKDYSKDKQEITNILESSVLGGRILYIEIQNDKGEKLKTNNNFLVSAEFNEDKSAAKNNDGVFYLTFPVHFYKTSEEILSLKLAFDESVITEDYESIKFTIAGILAIYFIAVLLFITGIISIIHKPIHFLRSQSKEIVNGKLDLPLTNKTRLKEIRYLTDDLEKMRGSLVGLAERMQYKATHDELTDLPNRYLFGDRLAKSISLSERENKEFAIVLLDLDHFKDINDTLGHGIGDEVLKVIAKRMLSGLRDADSIARIGGDEFALILMNVSQKLAIKIATKIKDLIKPAFEVKEHSLKIAASIGISVYPENGTDQEVLMRRADVAMYNAKHNNLQISAYHTDMDSDHYEKLMLANDLKKSIDTGMFEPVFQPKIDMLTNKVCGCELLLRWNHPTLGLIEPDKFIPIAERENLIGELTRWVITNYLHEFIDIIKLNNEFHVAINVSPIDLIDSILFESINEILDSINFPKNNFYIEVTENAIMKNPARSAEVLNMFNAAGILVSIDDFGTGYSSLSYLQKFPISELKIDKSFISGLTKDSNNYPIVTATITMAHDLGITVIAEGVETDSVIDLLKEMGCDRVQGYHFARPLKIDDFKSWLKDIKN